MTLSQIRHSLMVLWWSLGCHVFEIKHHKSSTMPMHNFMRVYQFHSSGWRREIFLMNLNKKPQNQHNTTLVLVSIFVITWHQEKQHFHFEFVNETNKSLQGNFLYFCSLEYQGWQANWVSRVFPSMRHFSIL